MYPTNTMKHKMRWLRIIIQHLILILLCLHFEPFPTLVDAGFAIRFRSATSDDVSLAKRALIKEAMNPLSISKEKLLVAYDMEDETDEMLGFGQIRPLKINDLNKLYELASLFVFRPKRSSGVGSALVNELLKRFDEDRQNNGNICLLTLKATIPFYLAFGFTVVIREDIPSPLMLEYTAGNIISNLLGNELCCMIREN